MDYKGHDDKAVRTLFQFSHNGKIIHTACAPLQRNGPSWEALESIGLKQTNRARMKMQAEVMRRLAETSVFIRSELQFA